MPFVLAKPRDPGRRHDIPTLGIFKGEGKHATVVFTMNKRFQDEHFGRVLNGGGAYVLIGNEADRGLIRIGVAAERDADFPGSILPHGPKNGVKICVEPAACFSDDLIRSAECTVESVTSMDDASWSIEAWLPGSALQLPQVRFESAPKQVKEPPVAPPAAETPAPSADADDGFKKFPANGPWPDELFAQLKERHGEGETVKALAGLVNASYNPFSAAFKDYRERADEAVGKDTHYPRGGPWPDELLESMVAKYEDGHLVAALAESIDANYQAFSAAFKAYRERVGINDRAADAPTTLPTKKQKPTLPARPKPKHCDPDPERELSGWSVRDDIELMESLGTGLPAKIVAQRINELGGSPVMIDDVVKRFKVLCPDPTPQRQGVVIGQLRKLQAAEDSESIDP